MYFLNYPTTVNVGILGRVMGPDQYGASYVAVQAEHDPDAGRCRVGFVPLPPAETRLEVRGLPREVYVSAAALAELTPAA